jgi:hypothetical protein
MGQQQTMRATGSALRRILLVLAVAALMAVMMVAMAAPAFALPPQAKPHPSQGRANPPTTAASNGCNGFEHTPANEPPFFQSVGC